MVNKRLFIFFLIGFTEKIKTYRPIILFFALLNFQYSYIVISLRLIVQYFLQERVTETSEAQTKSTSIMKCRKFEFMLEFNYSFIILYGSPCIC